MSNTIITSVVTGGVNNHTTVVEEINALSTDFVTQGVVGAISLNTGSGGTGSFCVNADASADMGVTIKAGQAYISATPSSQSLQVLRARAATDYTGYTINANASGSTKYDWIYLSVNATNANAPASDASNVTSIYTSRSSSNTTDNGTPPSFGLLLAVITVANGASSIANSNISDRRLNASIGTQGGSLVLTQQSSGADAIVQAAGPDANVNLNLATKGTGAVRINGLQLGTISSSSNLSSRSQALTPSGGASTAYSTLNPTMTLTPGKYLIVAVGSARASIAAQDSSFMAVLYNDTTSTEVASNGTASTGTSGVVNPVYSVHAIVTISSATTYSARVSQTYGTGATYTYVNSTLTVIPQSS